MAYNFQFHKHARVSLSVYFHSGEIASQSNVKMEQMDHKKHRTKVAGPKAERKSKKDQKSSASGSQESARQRNPKAFAVQSVVKAAKKFHR